jgi:hypothetical protein
MRTGTGKPTEDPNLRRSGYLAVTLLLATGGLAAAGVGGFDVFPVAVGLGAAWVVQAISFWLLAGALERGEMVMRVWTAGIASRLGGMALLWVLARLAGGPTREPVIAYAFALVAFLLLEAGWLTFLAPGRRQAGGAKGATVEDKSERPGLTDRE